MSQRRQTPSFKHLRPISEVSSRTKKAVRSQDTKPEIILRRTLWKRGLRYRVANRHLPGRPDVVFPTEKVAIFCDGDFWHGRDWDQRRKRLAAGANPQYWIKKIETNRTRDRRVTAELEGMGWKVLRFWEGEVLKDAESLASLIHQILLERRAGPTDPSD